MSRNSVGALVVIVVCSGCTQSAAPGGASANRTAPAANAASKTANDGTSSQPASAADSSVADNITLEEPTREHPFVAAAAIVPAKLAADGHATFVIQARTAPSWHIYAVGNRIGPTVATTLKLELPPGVEADGEWELPKATPGQEGALEYEGTFAFRQRLKTTSDLTAGPLVIRCELGYQACDPFGCRAPTKLHLEAAAEVNSAP